MVVAEQRPAFSGISPQLGSRLFEVLLQARVWSTADSSPLGSFISGFNTPSGIGPGPFKDIVCNEAFKEVAVEILEVVALQLNPNLPDSSVGFFPMARFF